MKDSIRAIYEKYSAGEISKSESLELLRALGDSRSHAAIDDEGRGLMFMRPVWDVEIHQPGDVLNPDAAEQIVVIGADDGQLQGIQKHYPDAVALEIDAQTTPENLLGAIGRVGLIDHLLWILPSRGANHSIDEAMIREQDSGVVLLFRLVKALLASSYGERRLGMTIVTTGTLAVRLDEPADPLHASVHGFVGSLAKEYPDWKIRLLDVELGAELSIEEIFSLPYDARGDSLVARGNEWYRRTAIPVRDLEIGEPTYREGGVYVVVGGAGGLGEIWSRKMVKEFQAQIVWLGRRPVDSEIQAKMDGLGGAVTYLRADASDLGELTRAYEEIKILHPQIHGVVHSAVGMFDESITKMDEGMFRAILSAKIDVSVRLAQVFEREGLDFALFFSSVASFGKRGGMSGYSAGCFFKDALAQQLSRTWACRVKVVNWGYWDVGTGDAISDKLKIRFAQSGVRPIGAEEGMEALEKLLNGSMDQLAVMKMDRLDVLEGMRSDDIFIQIKGALPSRIGRISNHLPVRDEAIEKLGSTGAFRDEKMAELQRRLLLGSLQQIGASQSVERAETSVIPFYERWLEESRSVLSESGIVKPDDEGSLAANGIDLEAEWDGWEKARANWDRDPANKGFLNLSEACLRALPEILTGRKEATDVIFPNSSMELVEDLYKGNPAIDFFNEVLADAVAAFIKERVEADPSARIRILEIGAGTGASTAKILPHLQDWKGNIDEYLYTDLSKSFLFHAENNYAPTNPFLRTAVFDVEKPLKYQGIEVGVYDIVIAANAVHATRNIRTSLRNAKAALRNKGLLFLNELCSKSLFTHLTFGLLEGWWLKEDAGLRIQGSPALIPESWGRALEDEGFQSVAFLIEEAHKLGGLVLAAESDGVVRQSVVQAQEPVPEPVRSAPAEMDPGELRERSVAYFKELLGEALHMETQRIDAAEPLESYGIDSILIVQITNRLREVFDDVSSTLFFENQTIDAVVDHFVCTRSDELIGVLGLAAPEESRPNSAAAGAQGAPSKIYEAPRTEVRIKSTDEPIAVIGMGGRYGGAEDLDAYWENLKSGKDCVTEIPADRWPVDESFFHPDPDEAVAQGKSYSKWGSFVEGAKDFDPLFFNLSPFEAIRMDPHERLFLQCAWKAVEDAGYCRASFESQHDGEVGVFAGITRIGIDLYGPDLWRQGDHIHLRTSFSSVSNRISYFMNLRGPSLPVDTMCSSSLTAVHEACEQIRRGACQMAIAGGVNLCLHPSSYVGLSSLKMLSKDGRCKSFGAGGDGFVPGEGVGAVILKPLSQAMADHDQIYGVIRASAVNHDGKTNGYTVPNPRAQAELVRGVLDTAGVNARDVSYLEAHGTGTALGDPIEVSALTEAFAQDTAETEFCSIGSAKSNLGHLEAAAGIAGLTKVLLQLKHGKLAPSLHANEPNPNLELGKTPFRVQQELADWRRPKIMRGGGEVELPRMAGISSFGAGGSNAHLLVEEFTGRGDRSERSEVPRVVVLSARDEDGLREVVGNLQVWMLRDPSINLADLAYTLQVGREAMELRLGLVVSSIQELQTSLSGFLEGRKLSELHLGEVRRDKGGLAALVGDDDMAKTIDAWIEKRKFSKLLDLWVKGFHIDWSQLYEGGKPFRISLPTYPFRRERYWLPEIKDVPTSGSAHFLHPMLHRNTGDLFELRFTSRFSGRESFLEDHVVDGKRTLPAVVYLEMARAALEHGAGFPTDAHGVRLKNVVWARPFVVHDEPMEVHLSLAEGGDGAVVFEIYSGADEGGGEVIVHSQGQASSFEIDVVSQSIDIEAALERHTAGRFDAEDCYAAFESIGVDYGPAHRGIEQLHLGDGEVLARLHPAPPRVPGDRYVLHPSVMDAAFQAFIGFGMGEGQGVVSGALPFAMDAIDIFESSTDAAWAWIRRSDSQVAESRLSKIDIDLCDDGGQVLVRVRGLASRETDSSQGEVGVLHCEPVWDFKDVSGDVSDPVDRLHQILFCGLAGDQETGLIENAECFSIQSDKDGMGSRYEDHAIQVLEKIRELLERKPKGAVIIQIVVPVRGEGRLLSGLGGILKSAQQENPQILGQLIEVDADSTSGVIREIVLENLYSSEDSHVRYRDGKRQVVSWEKIAAPAGELLPPWKSGGIYLITGGAGGLGLIFSRAIAEQTDGATLVLTGRSDLSEEREKAIGKIAKLGARIIYRKVDCSRPDEVTQLVRSIVSDEGTIDGVLHCAGILRDSFILKKTAQQLREVFAPKVTGAVLLDEATRELDLDFFVLFSSGAAVLGNVGQADYAAANGFLDSFAHYRNGLVAKSERKGKTVSIDWPLWKLGGMTIDAAKKKTLREGTGIIAMDSQSGVDSFCLAVGAGDSQCLVMEGELSKISEFLPLGRFPSEPESPVLIEAATELVAETPDPSTFEEGVIFYFKSLLSSTLALPAHRIREDQPFEKYGIDSILVMQLTNALEKVFGSLSKTLFFEYQTLKELAAYFIEVHRVRLQELVSPSATASEPEKARGRSGALPEPSKARRTPRRRRVATSKVQQLSERAVPGALDIAIVGLAGRYPQAPDLESYWENLRSGKDCITEVPPDRWDWRAFGSESADGESGGKWGGFIDDVDKFDPIFFNISPREAIFMDPQERIFLQTAWNALEDAGYTRHDLQNLPGSSPSAQVGVYAGLMYSEYQLYGAQETSFENPLALSGSYAGVANRVSYFLDVHGPSMTVDTMCSSSLTSIHLACQDLKLGRTDMGIAGGVNLSIHPNKYLMLGSGQFLASGGRCESFGKGGDGYVPGEGCGVAIVKRLADAVRDRDQIYGVIKGSVVNHGGKTNSYSVPNPNQQREAIARALREAAIDPERVGYLEAHGTGTKLGDPIEITGLTQAFEQAAGSQREARCLIGSVKSNIGHCESAAGIAGLTKVLLQMRNREMAPSLHSEVLNPHIDFASTPFVVNQELRGWDAPLVDGTEFPRVAGISSFGAGGSNAHMIVEEYVGRSERGDVPAGGEIFILSAGGEERLEEAATNFHAYVAGHPELGLVDLAYTLQVGREAMEERLGIVAQSRSDLLEKLGSFIAQGERPAGVFRGNSKRSREALAQFTVDEELQDAIGSWFQRRKYSKLVDLWTQGLELDWNRLYGDAKPYRVSSPGYPFAKERYWYEEAERVEGGQSRVLHPFIHENTSDVHGLRFSSEFSGEEFFLADHVIGGQRILPAAVYIELARAAALLSLGESVNGDNSVRIENIAWSRPIVVGEEAESVHIRLFAEGGDGLEFEVCNADDVPCAQGTVIVGDGGDLNGIDLQGLRARINSRRYSGDECYQRLRSFGADYGPGLRGIEELFAGDGECLARLSIPDPVRDFSDSLVLHPSIADSALHASVGLARGKGGDTPAGPTLPFALDSIEIAKPCTASMWVWLRPSSSSSPNGSIRKLDLDLFDEEGSLCASLRGLSSRSAGTEASPNSDRAGLLMRAPAWKKSFVSASGGSPQFAGHLVMSVGIEGLPTEQMEARGISWIQLQASSESPVNERFNGLSLQVFEAIKGIFGMRFAGEYLVQILVSPDSSDWLASGLVGLLKTAHIENPNLRCQLVEIENGADLIDLIDENLRLPRDGHVRYSGGERLLPFWDETVEQDRPAWSPWKDGGVYLITGGAGGLGLIVAGEIARETGGACLVLTGRSELDPEQSEQLRSIESSGATVEYLRTDICQEDEVVESVEGVVQKHGKIDGIIHAAGVTRDNFIIRKSAAEFEEVLAPKVSGLVFLDRVSSNLDLDFVVLFSSGAGALGNPGQSDYAAANGFMDSFAANRNALVREGKRSGRTISINWPLWKEGGMRIDDEASRVMEENAGLVPLETAVGMTALYSGLASEYSQVLVLSGDPDRLESYLAGGDRVGREGLEPETEAATDQGVSTERAGEYFKGMISSTLKLPVHRIQVDEPLEKYGIDSVMAMDWTNRLEAVFGPLSKTLFFEYQTIEELCHYFQSAHAAKLKELVEPDTPHVPVIPPLVSANGGAQRDKRRSRAAFSSREPRNEPESGSLDIAVVGMAGRYPQADDLKAFWENLRDGRDCITEVPEERWDWRRYYSEDADRPDGHLSKWGGFVGGVEMFDPLFFNISPMEAEIMDPQERMFLQTVWSAMEDAGIRREDLRGRSEDPGRVGVYAGAMYGEYQLLGAEETLRGNPVALSSNFASIANRVSYFLDLHGPSMTVDTMCSSSLTCIHLACQDLKSGRTDLGIAGGVNLSIHPNKYLMLSRGQFISNRGHCESFGVGGDGYIPGEGVGVVFLKRLDEARQDGDRIYGVIKGSAANHDGKTNGYSVPNPVAQQRVIAQALEESGIDPARIGYVEAHGTGTKLGDPIEITGLTRAYREKTDGSQFCRIGSVKSNIGHCESAAGIAGFSKVLLQLEHRQLAPSLHAKELNPHIDFAATPFEVNQELSDWIPVGANGEMLPRVAGISSFGAGGSNAHMIVEEYIGQGVRSSDEGNSGQQIVVLSAKGEDRLREMVSNLVRHIADSPTLRLVDLAYTLQLGREPMDERLGLIVGSVEELEQKLTRFVNGEDGVDGLLRANLKQRPDAALSLFAGDEDLDATVEAWISKRKLGKVLDLWLNGVSIDWERLHDGTDPRRIGLPSYPFARTRYWPKKSVSPPGLNGSNGSSGIRQDSNIASERQEEWLFVEERWNVQALPPDLDWKESLQGKSGQRIAVVYSGENDRGTLCKLIDDLQVVAQLDEPLDIRCIHTDDVIAPDAFAEAPQTVFFVVADSGVEPVRQAFNLSKSLMAQAWGEEVSIYCLYSGDAKTPRVECEALSGFANSAEMEHEFHRWRLIGSFEPDGSSSPHGQLVQEWLADQGSSGIRTLEVRYQNSERLVKKISETSLDMEAAPGFRKNGVYLIAGGFGPLGELLCEELASRFEATLLVLSRSPLDKVKQERCEKLRDLGASAVQYFQVDIADRSALEEIYPSIEEAGGEIHGVIHLARQVEDGPIIAKTWDSFQSVIRAKVDGTLNLDEVTACEKLDFFMMFSSMAAFGIRGSSDYGYSSAFQNAFARYRSALGEDGTRSGVTVSQCWGSWTVDRYNPEGREEHLESAGFGLIQMADAFPVIESCCPIGKPVVGLMAVTDRGLAAAELGLTGGAPADVGSLEERLGELEKRGPREESISVREAFSRKEIEAMPPSLVERLYDIAFEESMPECLGETAVSPSLRELDDGSIRVAIRETLTDILKLDAVDDGETFQNYGLESVSAIVFATRLGKRVGQEVQPEWFIEFSTVDSLGAHLERELKGASN